MLGSRRVLALAASLAATGAFLAEQAAGPSQTAGARRCPLWINMDPASGIRCEVVEARFVTEVEGVAGNALRVPKERLHLFRIALVTLKITKPAGQKLTLAAADLSCHYYHGDSVEVAPCEGISSFGMRKDDDRPLSLPPMSGPGFTKSTTSARATQAAVVYLDAVFGFIEPDVRDLWVAVGQPITEEPFAVDGWGRASP